MTGGGRNTVVLAGWLGCRPKSLRRFEAMYRELGWDVIIRIASPVLVVKAATGISDINRFGASSSGNAASAKISSMHGLAVQTIQELQDSQCSAFIFHTFSNGGAFLWEEIRDILKSTSIRREDTINADILRSKLVGVVFDSSPAYYADGKADTLSEALSFATAEEQKEAKSILETKRSEIGDAPFEEFRVQRAREYWQSMRNDDLNVPHLYVYSMVDRLAPYKAIDELVEHRRSIFGNDNIISQKFVDSPHCCHLLKYPDQYRLALKDFLSSCLHGYGDNSIVRSRL